MRDEQEMLKAREEISRLREALRAAPMPYSESVLKENWDEVYADWWHKYASEKALGEG